MSSFDPSNTLPAGAPSPFDRHTDTESKPAAAADSSIFNFTAALNSRAPSKCVLSLRACAKSVTARTYAMRQHAPAHGVFEGQQPGLREMHIVGFDGALDALDRDGAIRLVFQRLGLNAAEDCRAALLILISVGLLPDQIFLAPGAMSHERRQVALRAGGKEQRRCEAEAFRHDGLQPVDRRIVPVDVVSHLCRRHGRAHFRRGPRHGIAAHVD